MTHECKRVGGINLSQGVCDLGVPEPVVRGVQDAMAAGINSYTHYQGRGSLRGAIANRLGQYGFNADPDREITVTIGATGAFYCACMTLLNPGDEFILLEPYYGYHLSILRSLDVTPRYVPLHAPDWSLSMDELEAAITPKTKAIMLCTPANPCGKVFSRAELEKLRDVVVKHDLYVITDEMYEYFLYDGRTHIPPASIDGMWDRTITVSGFSKTYNITGWRIGYSYCKPELAQLVGYFNDQAYVCAPAPLQEGVARGLEELPDSYYTDLAATFTAKRDLICNALTEAGMKPYVPEGAYYTLADISRLPGETGKERAMHLLDKTGIACVPGEAFYQHPADGATIARFCFAKTDEELTQAVAGLQAL
jgi:aminotransferase